MRTTCSCPRRRGCATTSPAAPSSSGTPLRSVLATAYGWPSRTSGDSTIWHARSKVGPAPRSLSLVGFEHVQLKVGEPIGRLTLDRPERRNALSLAAMREIITALRTVADDPAVRVLIIDGNGSAFSAGHDLAEIVATREDAFYAELFAVCVEMMEQIHALG